MRHLAYEHSLGAMTRLTLTLLVSFVPLANAGVGDVYYCVQNRVDVIEAGAGHSELMLDKFTMKWLEGEIRRKSGSEYSMPILFSAQETFTAGKTDSKVIEHWSLNDGRFQSVFSMNDLRSSVIIVNATCDKFD